MRIKYLTIEQIQALMRAARKHARGSNGARNAAMILIAFRHGLRISELCGLKWCDIDFQRAELRISRVKGSNSGTHPMEPDEVEALHGLENGSEHVFLSERGTAMGARGFNKMLEVVGAKAGLPRELCSAKALRHGAGFYLANNDVNIRVIQDFLGHKDIKNTALYTAMAPVRFRGLFAETVAA